MNDIKFKLLEEMRADLTLEDAINLHEDGICTVCEDGKASRFDFECTVEYKVG